MKYSVIMALVAFGLLTLFSPVAHAESSAASLEEQAESVQALFAESEGDAPVIGEELQAYFLDLPAHAHRLFAEAVDEGIISGATHARRLLSMQLDTDQMELVLRDNCILCHTDSDMQDESTLWTVPGDELDNGGMVLGEFLNDVHFRQGLSCSGCHGGSPGDTDMADEIYERWPESPGRYTDRTWIPQFCSRCHSDPSFMRSFNPRLPTDQMAKYRESRHGDLLEQGDSKAAQCVSCHGKHGIRRSDSRRSKTHKQNIPTTCGRCHGDPQYMAGYTTPDGSPLPTDQLEKYRRSVHGKALLERGDMGAPVCNDCHGNHAAMPPQVAAVSQVCRNCHSINGSLFDGSRHKEVFVEHGWPECGQCHGKHEIQKLDERMLASSPGALCYDCHLEYAQENDDCQAGAEHFRSTLATLAEASEGFEHRAEALAERGLDVDELNGSLAELHDALRSSRAAIHAFDQSDFDEVAAPGLAAIIAGEASIEAAEAEYSFRRTGLLLSILVMALLALLLFLKIRQIES